MKISLLNLFISAAFFSCSSPQEPGKKNQDPADSLPVGKHAAFRMELENIIKPYKATVGIALIALEDRDTLTINNDHAYPMQSVYKFPLAMAVLHLVDEGKLSLGQKVMIQKKDLHKTWSPLREKYPDGNADVTVARLIEYTVSQSDNNACDILFRLAGGTKAVETYVHGLGIKEIAIAATEHEMSQEWKVQYTNWVRPYAMASLLDVFYHGKHLSDSSHRFLMKAMLETSTGPLRLKGLLPEGTPVAHKTGTSGANEDGIIAGTNDVGIITLPNGKHLAIAVFVTDAAETWETNEKIIAEVSKAAFNYFGVTGKRRTTVKPSNIKVKNSYLDN